MNQTQAEDKLRPMIATVSQLFYGGKDFKVFGTFVMAPRLTITPGFMPNGNLMPIPGNRMGIEVTRGLMNLSELPLMFALGHEMGHGFSEQALETIGLKGTSGCVTEVIADLGSAYLLSKSGYKWADIVDTAEKGVTLGIFDAGWSGDHPPGRMRGDCVRSLSELMAGGGDFALPAKAICLSMLGAKPT